MKKFYLFFLLCLALTGMQAQEQLPTWAHELYNQNQGVIDSIKLYRANPSAPETRTYAIFYNQPLLHNQPDGAHFPLRALLTVYNDADPTQAVNHVYCSGYSIMQGSVEYPDSLFMLFGTEAPTEIAKRYHANYIQIEHRYFQYSSPAECWKNLDPLTAEEAAADFHNLFTALKKVLKGKYVMSGVSKGGIATLLQHRFYPEDMDIFVPYSAPFFDSDRDTELQHYFFTQGLTPRHNDWLMSIRKFGLDYIEQTYAIYEKMMGGATTQSKRDTIYGYYLASIGRLGHGEHAYLDTATINLQTHKNDSIMKEKGVVFSDTVCAYMVYKNSINLDSFPSWLDTLRKYPDPQQAPVRRMHVVKTEPFGVTYKEWWNNDPVGNPNANGYEYQSKRELGFFDIRFDLIYPDEPEKGAMWNNYWIEKYGCLHNVLSPQFASITFDRSLYDATMQTTQNALKPIVLIYGEDDSWTGAAVKDEFINGTNVRKFILPAQNHNVHFSSNTDRSKCDEIRSILDGILGTPAGVEDIYYKTDNQTDMTIRKILRNGQILILRGNKIYNLQGQEIK